MRIGAVHEHADLADAGIEIVGRQRAELRVALVQSCRIILTHIEDDGRPVEIERLVEPKVDRARDAAFDLIGGL